MPFEPGKAPNLFRFLKRNSQLRPIFRCAACAFLTRIEAARGLAQARNALLLAELRFAPAGALRGALCRVASLDAAHLRFAGPVATWT